MENLALLGGGLLTAAECAFKNAFYDGDGKRVKSILQMTSAEITTYFIGNYYEVSGSSITKYYYAGAQCIAISKGGTL